MRIVVNQLRERLDKHNGNRISVQDMLDEICAKLREQISVMEENVNNALMKAFGEEDNEMQETLNSILKLAGIEKRSPEQDKELAALVVKAKAVLLVKRSYDLRRQKAKGPEKKAPKRPRGRGGRYGRMPFYDDSDSDSDSDVDDPLQDEKQNEEEGESGDNQDPDLSKLYELAVKDEVEADVLGSRKLTSLKVEKVEAGRVHLGFCGVLNEEEKRVLASHGFKESIRYRTAVCKSGSDEWAEYWAKAGDDESSCSFLPQLEAGATYAVKARAELGESASEWSDPVELDVSFKSFLGWKECAEGIKLSKVYSLSKDNPMVATATSTNTRMRLLEANMALPPNRVSSWTVKILSAPVNNCIHVGVVPSERDPHEYEGVGRFLVCNNSTLTKMPMEAYMYHEMNMEAKKKWEQRNLKSGDSVGVVMDATKGELSFVVNGVNLGVAFEGIPLDKPLVPCVTLWSEGDSVEFI